MKYKNFCGNSLELDRVPRLTIDETTELAEAELTGRRNKIENAYDERVAQINANAIARGMVNSSTTIELLDKAYEKRQDALERLENLCSKLAKKILADNIKLATSVERERAAQRSRAIRDFVAGKSLELKIIWTSSTVTAAIQDEIYYAYQQWLLRYDAETAWQYVNANDLFTINMGTTKRNALLADMNLRRV